MTKEKEKIRTLRHDEEAAHFKMLNLCYEPWGSLEEWKRRYVEHPDFDVTKNVVIVEEGGEWAGGGTAWFRQALLKNNSPIQIYGAGDLYVHPNHRGKGIYSSAMRGLNKLAMERGAILGFAYPSIYRLPAMALPKYGFIEVFYPTTHVLVLNPDKFFQFLISRAKKAFYSPKFNGIKLRITVVFDTPIRKCDITRTFRIEDGQFLELQENHGAEKVDLELKAEVGVLLRIVSAFYLGTKNLLVSIFSSLLKRRLRVRFSIKFLKQFLGL